MEGDEMTRKDEIQSSTGKLLEVTRYIHNIDHSGGFTGVYICQILSSYTP